MSLWRQLTHGLRVLTHRRLRPGRRRRSEHYLEQLIAAHVARGLPVKKPPCGAVELGNVTVIREEVRAGGWENAIDTVLSDLRYAARRLRSNPGFSAVSVLTLALGIGATTAIFSAVNPILFEPLPYPHAGRIAMIWDFGVDRSRIEVTFGTYRELIERSRSFDAIAVMKPWQPAMTGTGEPERFDGQRVSASYFRRWCTPGAGPDFEADDDPRTQCGDPATGGGGASAVTPRSLDVGSRSTTTAIPSSA
jgi:hypothetical protein